MSLERRAYAHWYGDNRRTKNPLIRAFQRVRLEHAVNSGDPGLASQLGDSYGLSHDDHTSAVIRAAINMHLREGRIALANGLTDLIRRGEEYKRADRLKFGRV